MKIYEVTIKGASPLLMHNSRLANPFDNIVQAMKPLQKKRNKTTDDMEELARLEFLGGLYVDDEGAPCLPGHVIEGLFVQTFRAARQTKDAMSGIMSEGDWPIQYNGPKDSNKLWEKRAEFSDFRMVALKKSSRIGRTRPIFRKWACTFRIAIDGAAADPKTAKERLEHAGAYIGVGDYRPRFGRFTVESFKEVA